MFAVKAARAAAQRKDAGEAKPAIERFLGSGLAELGDKLGPVLWQLPAGRRFDPDQFARFLDLLPPSLGRPAAPPRLGGGARKLWNDAAVALLRERGVARVILDKPGTAPWTGDHRRSRLSAAARDGGRGAGRLHAGGHSMRGPRKLKALAKPEGRRVFAYVISGAKHRAPAAAMALIERIAAAS